LLHRIAPRAPLDTAFQVTYGSNAQVGVLGKFLLRETAGGAMGA
jgi:hypothetical protein